MRTLILSLAMLAALIPITVRAQVSSGQECYTTDREGKVIPCPLVYPMLYDVPEGNHVYAEIDYGATVLISCAGKDGKISRCELGAGATLEHVMQVMLDDQKQEAQACTARKFDKDEIIRKLRADIIALKAQKGGK